MLISAQIIYPSANQTNTISPVIVNGSLPFTITIEQIDLQIPGGIHSAAFAQYGSRYLFITGRTNGLHGFNNDNNNFPPSQQNSNVLVIDFCANAVYSRSLYDPKSGLTQQQIDTLSVTSPQSYQTGNTLYITGGYGVDTITGNFSTKSVLTAIDVPGLMRWVTEPTSGCLASNYIRQISNPIFQVTGGNMYQVGQNPTLLIFGQNFDGFYNGSSNGIYTHQVRRFNIIDDGNCLSVAVKESTTPDPDYRRRDHNVVPIIKKNGGCNIPAFVALSGVFTINTGVWTVPVEITACGDTYMSDPNLADTFKQGMNNYVCPHAEIVAKNGSNYIILFGGITFEYYQNGAFFTDPNIPFTNNVTIIERNRNGQYTQYLSPTEFPTIISTASNPGNTLLFGAGGRWAPAPNVPAYSNGVIDLAHIKKPTVIGHVMGGIQSTLPNTNVPSDSAASPYIFKVTLTPNCQKCR